MQAVMATLGTGMTKALVNDGDGWIVADGDEGGVEGASYRSATPHDHAAAAERAASSRFMGATPTRAVDLAAIQKTQFREMSQ